MCLGMVLYVSMNVSENGTVLLCMCLGMGLCVIMYVPGNETVCYACVWEWDCAMYGNGTVLLCMCLVILALNIHTQNQPMNESTFSCHPQAPPSIKLYITSGVMYAYIQLTQTKVYFFSH